MIIFLSLLVLVAGAIILFLKLKIKAWVVFGLSVLVGMFGYWRITRVEYIEFGPHVDIESWKVGGFLFLTLLFEVAFIIGLWKFVHRKVGDSGDRGQP